MDAFELWLGRAAGVAGLLTLALALAAMFRSLRRAPGREEPGARRWLRLPFLAISSVLFLVIGALLWRPIPIRLCVGCRLAADLLGAVVFIGGLGLYLWGLHSLGAMFGPSVSLGVRLYAQHRLITTGPFALVRHPMYLGVCAAGAGSLLLYRTWAALAFALFIFGLQVRARREEKVLEEEFAAEWRAYAARVPAWLPRWNRRSGS